MQGYKMTFFVYADSQEEADAAAKAVKDFISVQAEKGRAVTAKKIAEAVERYKDNYFVNAYFK